MQAELALQQQERRVAVQQRLEHEGDEAARLEYELYRERSRVEGQMQQQQQQAEYALMQAQTLTQP